MSTNYKVVFQNNSMSYGSACLFYHLNGSEQMPLAWLTKAAYPTSKVYFKFNLNYSFVWGEMDSCAPGNIFEPSQLWEADVSAKNHITFTKPSEAYTFDDLTVGAQPGNLEITQSSTITTLNPPYVGIGLSDSPLIITCAHPNAKASFNVPQIPELYIAFGDFERGQVLAVERLSTSLGYIKFESGVTTISAVLQADSTWIINPIESD